MSEGFYWDIGFDSIFLYIVYIVEMTGAVESYCARGVRVEMIFDKDWDTLPD